VPAGFPEITATRLARGIARCPRRKRPAGRSVISVSRRAFSFSRESRARPCSGSRSLPPTCKSRRVYSARSGARLSRRSREPREPRCHSIRTRGSPRARGNVLNARADSTPARSRKNSRIRAERPARLSVPRALSASEPREESLLASAKANEKRIFRTAPAARHLPRLGPRSMHRAHPRDTRDDAISSVTDFPLPRRSSAATGWVRRMDSTDGFDGWLARYARNWPRRHSSSRVESHRLEGNRNSVLTLHASRVASRTVTNAGRVMALLPPRLQRAPPPLLTSPVHVYPLPTSS